ncbi:MAG: hypothetical protein HY360_05215 [Verrucomicrobia bacterium]|nr:hypothetical protein [Verrucomicrobiota bacterium]
MPLALDRETDAKWFLTAKSLALIVPGLDQDGRGTWWKRVLSGAVSEKVRLVEMDGCGTEVSWSWDKVMTQ